MTDQALVIGYGNELRRDDGAGQCLVRAIINQEWPGVRALAVHQLTPELAEPLANSGIAVFVDAVDSDKEVHVQPVASAPDRLTSNHASDPASLLRLAEIVFGHRPLAWLVTVPATDFSFGIGLSSITENRVKEALAMVRQLISGIGRA